MIYEVIMQQIEEYKFDIEADDEDAALVIAYNLNDTLDEKELKESYHSDSETKFLNPYIIKR